MSEQTKIEILAAYPNLITYAGRSLIDGIDVTYAFEYAAEAGKDAAFAIDHIELMLGEAAIFAFGADAPGERASA